MRYKQWCPAVCIKQIVAKDLSRQSVGNPGVWHGAGAAQITAILPLDATETPTNTVIAGLCRHLNFHLIDPSYSYGGSRSLTLDQDRVNPR